MKDLHISKLKTTSKSNKSKKAKLRFLTFFKNKLSFSTYLKFQNTFLIHFKLLDWG